MAESRGLHRAAALAEEEQPTGGKEERRKRELNEEEDETSVVAKEPRLSRREEMQLRLLASVPALNGPMRDERGRRRAFSITHSDLINAGLSAIIADAELNGDRDYARLQADVDSDDDAERQAESGEDADRYSLHTSIKI
jgi:hypothetical protein